MQRQGGEHRLASVIPLRLKEFPAEFFKANSLLRRQLAPRRWQVDLSSENTLAFNVSTPLHDVLIHFRAEHQP